MHAVIKVFKYQSRTHIYSLLKELTVQCKELVLVVFARDVVHLDLLVLHRQYRSFKPIGSEGANTLLVTMP